MGEVVYAKSTAGIAASVAAAVATAIDLGLPIVTSTRDGHEGRPGPSEQPGVTLGQQAASIPFAASAVAAAVAGAPSTADARPDMARSPPQSQFRFRSLAPPSKPGDEFNPCCDAVYTTYQPGFGPQEPLCDAFKCPPPEVKMPSIPLSPGGATRRSLSQATSALCPDPTVCGGPRGRRLAPSLELPPRLVLSTSSPS